MDKSKTPALAEALKERDQWYGEAQHRAIRINTLADMLKMANKRAEAAEARLAGVASVIDELRELRERGKDRARYIDWNALFQFANKLQAIMERDNDT